MTKVQKTTTFGQLYSFEFVATDSKSTLFRDALHFLIWRVLKLDKVPILGLRTRQCSLGARLNIYDIYHRRRHKAVCARVLVYARRRTRVLF